MYFIYLSMYSQLYKSNFARKTMCSIAIAEMQTAVLQVLLYLQAQADPNVDRRKQTCLSLSMPKNSCFLCAAKNGFLHHVASLTLKFFFCV